jgi:hemoglobin
MAKAMMEWSKSEDKVMKLKVLLLLSMGMLSACWMPTKPDASLYTRLGGKPALEAISSDLLDATSTDERTKRSFKDVKLSAVKESLTLYLCEKTGGNCVYEGETMKNSHADAKITTAEFELMVQQLRDVLDAHNIGTREKNELLKILAPTKRDIVTPEASNT